MSVFKDFLESITIAGEPLVPQREAYRMDGTFPDPDMRRRAGLGTCNCCDYFTFGADNGVILIEETRLGDRIKDLMEKYKYLDDTDQRNHVTRLILQENRLKAYGSLLVLCRLFSKKADAVAASISSDTKYSFWLVASVKEPADDVFAMDYFKDRLGRQLRDVLTKAVVDSVEVVPAEALAAKLASAGGMTDQGPGIS